MITVTAPIALTEVDQVLFPLAWKAKNLGAESYVASETHVGYLIKLEHSSMLDHATIEGIVAAGGDVTNLPLFIVIDPTAEHHQDEELNSITWAQYAASIGHVPVEIGGAFYMEATNGQTNWAASEVIASGLTWLTITEYKAILPVGEV